MMHGQDGVVVVGHRAQLCVAGSSEGVAVVGDRVQDGVVGIPGSVVGCWVPVGVVGSYGGVAV